MKTHAHQADDSKTVMEKTVKNIVVKRFTFIDEGNWTREVLNPENGLPRESEENRIEIVTVGKNGKELKTPRLQRVNTRKFCDGNGIKRTEIVQINDEEKEIVRMFRENGKRESEFEYGAGRREGKYTLFDQNEQEIGQGKLVDGVLPKNIDETGKLKNIVALLKKS
jgi:hypothetical protein